MKKILGGGLVLAATAAVAQEDAVVVTATRVPQPSLEVPASVDRLYADEIREGRPQVNLSESLGRVPGIRPIAAGIPATMPDGQGQAATFALGSAERIEVLRGPFSALYGNAAGGVIVVETAEPPLQPAVDIDVFAGSYDTWRAATRLGATQGALGGLF